METMRVLVACCLQQQAFNKYYYELASKLCSHAKHHKFTLQGCTEEYHMLPNLLNHHRAILKSHCNLWDWGKIEIGVWERTIMNVVLYKLFKSDSCIFSSFSEHVNLFF
ncbi:unnamed protein product [Cuscuta epithymum]|uniref:Uncharacterized protein n=1 Tax=Cuscuta epithymum TaxID=186058 RepID=A0AAV0GEI3_9ASTE|nr:unnamed protein product [Cuscuta epithymum]